MRARVQRALKGAFFLTGMAGRWNAEWLHRMRSQSIDSVVIFDEEGNLGIDMTVRSVIF